MFRRISAFLAASMMIMMSVGAFSLATAKTRTNETEALRVREPLNIAILIQDDLISRVGNELGVTRDFIRSLPAGSRVMVGYITAGSLQVRQPFTSDLDRAAKSLRIPIAVGVQPIRRSDRCAQEIRSKLEGAQCGPADLGRT
jgi:hypothetical protein